MSDEQLHDEILTFFLAGHETAALSLTWAAYLLATHPEMQERARKKCLQSPEEVTFGQSTTRICAL
jgi:cytochrome P450